MTETIPYLPGLSPVAGKELCARFDGGRLSSDGGVLLFPGIERRLGIADALTPEMSYAERFVWKKRFYELAIPCHFDQQLLRVAKTGNRLVAVFENLVTNEITEKEADQIVVEHGTRPADAVFHGLTSEARNLGVTDIDALLNGAPQPADQNPQGAYELYRIGDCVTSRNIPAAIYDALRLCHRL